MSSRLRGAHLSAAILRRATTKSWRDTVDMTSSTILLLGRTGSQHHQPTLYTINVEACDAQIKASSLEYEDWWNGVISVSATEAQLDHTHCKTAAHCHVGWSVADVMSVSRIQTALMTSPHILIFAIENCAVWCKRILEDRCLQCWFSLGSLFYSQ